MSNASGSTHVLEGTTPPGIASRVRVPQLDAITRCAAEVEGDSLLLGKLDIAAGRRKKAVVHSIIHRAMEHHDMASHRRDIG